MTIIIQAPYNTVDLFVLRIDPMQTCFVVENQMPGDTHVEILRTGKSVAEIVRNEDVMLLSACQSGERHD